MSDHRFLFGTPAKPYVPSRKGHCGTFILGAYPSAIYVKWLPGKLPSIAAIAVADEPEPFWEGHDEVLLVLRWRQSLQWNSAWGEVQPAGRLNGSSGVWLKENVLDPLRLQRQAIWITDCLDIYHESKSAAARLDSPSFRRFMAQNRIPDRVLPAHPTEAQIVRGAQLERLNVELRECQPQRIITLGNAALRVFDGLLEKPGAHSKLSPDKTYGRPLSVRTAFGSSVEWIPLAHPAAPKAFQAAHMRWLTRLHRAA